MVHGGNYPDFFYALSHDFRIFFLRKKQATNGRGFLNPSGSTYWLAALPPWVIGLTSIPTTASQ